jgi:hypothetical protein
MGWQQNANDDWRRIGSGRHVVCDATVAVVINFVRSNYFVLVFGAIIGLVAVSLLPLMYGLALAEYDRRTPVWTDADSQIVGQGAGYVSVQILATRHRPECRFLRLHAQGLTSQGALDIPYQRIDRPMTGTTRPPGRQVVGVFRLDEIADNMLAVRFNAEHSCSGRFVASTLDIVEIPR